MDIEEWKVPVDWCCRNTRDSNGRGNWQMANYYYIKKDREDEVLAMAALLDLGKPTTTTAHVALKIAPKTGRLCINYRHVGPGTPSTWDDEKKDET